MISLRLLNLILAALVLRQKNCISAFSSVTSCAKIRHGARHSSIIRLWSDSSTGAGGCEGIVDGSSSSGNGNEGRQSRSSHIVSIKSSNIASMINDAEDEGGIEVDFGDDACLIAVTGESGSGKSLLVSKAIDLVTGGKAVSSLVPLPSGGEGSEQESSSSVELTVNLYEPHLTAVSATLQRFGIDSSILDNKQNKGGRQLHLKRTLSASNAGRLKSVCRINGKHISLNTLRQISAPLFTRVDVAAASAALGRPASRLTILDMGVPDRLKRNCAKLRDIYRQARKQTEKIKQDLESRVLPSSMQSGRNDVGFDEEQMKLLEHWVEELDMFETRINRFQESVSAQYNELLPELNANHASANSGISKTLKKLHKTTWGEMQHSDLDDDSLFANLIDFREEMRAVETQLVSAHSAYGSLTSLSDTNSALVALENTRKLLYGIYNDDSGPLFESVEKTHELLNDVEAALNDCARSIDGSSDSIISTLENMVFTGVSIEEVDAVIADWNALARKHGISPYSLPNCHMSIRQELDGNVEALEILPEAKENERIALENYSFACKELSEARKDVASQLSRSVTNILPSLGLESSALQVQLSLRPGGYEEPYYGSENLGVDFADFLLLHKKNNNGSNASEDALETTRGGNIEQVGSSGEKSRVLLAIETALPGSIGSTCNSFSTSAENLSSQEDSKTTPISIIYDEIDAHVGGRAAVTMAKLLADQSRSGYSSNNVKGVEGGSQIIAITHCASLAAIADRHIVVERGVSSRSTSSPIRTYVADESSRRKEIARMASGDLASGEAETFADALIRDALRHRETSLS